MHQSINGSITRASARPILSQARQRIQESTNYGEKYEPQLPWHTEFLRQATNFVVLPWKQAKPQNSDFSAEIVLFMENTSNQ